MIYHIAYHEQSKYSFGVKPFGYVLFAEWSGEYYILDSIEEV